MRTFILRSERSATPPESEAFDQRFDTRYAEKVIGNLEGRDDFCTACGGDCISCRRAYGRRLGDRIAGVVGLPDRLPYVLEEPGKLLPYDVPRHDVVLALNIHEQVLLEALKRARRWGTRALVAPIEAPGRVSKSAQAEAREIAADQGLEVAFPRPFCDFDPPEGSLLAEFRRTFHIGKPEVSLQVRDGVIERARVEVSAACGATYFVARWLAGKRVDEDLRYDVVARRLHSYPCTASMEWVEELGDTIMHKAGEAHYEILDALDGGAHGGPEMLTSPLGRPVVKPAPAHENKRNIEQAREDILRRLEQAESLRLSELRTGARFPPAAVQSALLLLNQEGKIKRDGAHIVRN